VSQIINFNQLNYKDFQQLVFRDKIPVVLVFEASWSGNSEIMRSMINRVSSKCNRNISYYFVDVDKEEEIAKLLGITYVPTTVLIKNGEIFEFIKGLLPSSKLNAKLDRFANKQTQN